MSDRLFKLSLTALAVTCLLLPLAAVAQEDAAGPLLWISYVTAEPGKSGELGMHLAAEGAKSYDGLVADGHVMSWGVAQAVNHFPGDDWTHLEFINFRDWAAVGEFINGFMGRMQAMSEEDRMAAAEKWDELTVHGSHYDVIGQHQHLATMGGRPSYIYLSTFATKPGQEPAAVKAMYEKWRAPMMDGLMEAGSIIAHGVYTPYLHNAEGWDDATAWFTMSGLGSVDAVHAAVIADGSSRSEDEQAAWMAEMMEKFEMPGEGNHEDRILVVTHYAEAAPPSE